METMYDRIKKLRNEFGWSQEELAKKVGYADKTSIAKIESGKVDIPQSKIVAFADALLTTTSYLMDGVGLSDYDIGNVFYDNMKQGSLEGLRSFLSESDVAHFESYLKLNSTNKKMADNYTNKLLKIQSLDEELEVSAAHERTDIEVTNEMKKHDDDIMNDDSEWD